VSSAGALGYLLCFRPHALHLIPPPSPHPHAPHALVSFRIAFCILRRPRAEGALAVCASAASLWVWPCHRGVQGRRKPLRVVVYLAVRAGSLVRGREGECGKDIYFDSSLIVENVLE
jgi:hypothetical protein